MIDRHELKEINEQIKKMMQSYPPQDGYSYFLPSPNEGKRLLIHGWLSPWEAADIAQKIWNGEASIDSLDCVEEIEVNFKECNWHVTGIQRKASRFHR